MENSTQIEIHELELDELRRITWTYAKDGVVGYHRDVVLRVHLFEVVDSGDVHPHTIQGCNVSEGWIEHIVYESYPEVKTFIEFMRAAPKPERDENGDVLIERVYCDVVVNLLGVKGNTILTLRKE